MIAKFKIKDLKSCKRHIEIEIPYAEIENKFEEVYKDILKRAKIDGFRPGKAPLNLVKDQFSDVAREEVLKRAISDAYIYVLEKEDIRPIGHPEINDVKFEQGQPLSFKATVEVHPRAQIKSYKDIKVVKKKADVSDIEIKEALNNLTESYAQFIQITENRPVRDQDYVIADVECFVKDRSIDKKPNSWLYVSKGSKDPNLTNDLIDRNISDVVEVNMKLPDNFLKREYRSQDAKFVIHIKEIRQKNLPVLSDEFAKDVGKFETLKDLEEALKKELLHRKGHNIRLDMENQIAKTLLKNSDFELPQTLVNEQAKHILEERSKSMAKENLSKDDIESKLKDLQESVIIDAQDQLKIYYIFDTISEIENIEVTDEELDNYLDVLIKNYNPGQDAEKLKNQLKDEDYDDARLRLRNKKIMDLLIKKATIVDTE